MLYQTPGLLHPLLKWVYELGVFLVDLKFWCTSLIRNRPWGAISVNEKPEKLLSRRLQLHFFLTTLVWNVFLSAELSLSLINNWSLHPKRSGLFTAHQPFLKCVIWFSFTALRHFSVSFYFLIYFFHVYLFSFKHIVFMFVFTFVSVKQIVYSLYRLSYLFIYLF